MKQIYFSLLLVTNECAVAHAEDILRPEELPAFSKFQECETCPEMIILPNGEFMAGKPPDSEYFNYFPDRIRKNAQRDVRVSRFAIGKYEVTVGEFRAFVRETGYEAGDRCATLESSKHNYTPGRNWRNPSFLQGESHPAVCISKSDAEAYIDWLNAKVGGGYRLPSEMEWEYAARGGDVRSSPWSGNISEHCIFGNNASRGDFKETIDIDFDTFCADGFVFTAEVGSFRGNPYGLHDMLGNAQEWMADCWNESLENAPRDGSPWMRGASWFTGECERHTIRGGHWFVLPQAVTYAMRGPMKNTRSCLNGFRVARSLFGGS